MTGRSEEFRAFALDRSLRLHQSAYLLCGDWHLAHDIVQDTLVKVYRHWSRVRQADSPDAYVRRILINEARDRWRRRDKAMQVADVGAEQAVPAVPDATDDIARRDGLLRALDGHRVINLNDTQVNYGPRTWSYRTEEFSSPISGPAPTAPVNGVSYIPAASVKAMLAQGNVKIVGHPVVEGHRTVELTVSLGKQGKEEANFFYVDSQTFQLVRLVRVFAPDSAHPASKTSDYIWVQRTPALTKLINHPQIPAGFTQVPTGS